jgi:hypothetical protein
MTEQLIQTGNREYIRADRIIQLAHGRGASELTNRSLKEFMGKEQLPFKLFGMNAAYYYVMVISHFLCECYKEDVAYDVVPLGSYPTTFRRKLIDFAAKVIETGNRIILQVSQGIWAQHKIQIIWNRCTNPIAQLL